MCEEEDLARNKANRKRQLWWEQRRGTDEKNVRQPPKHSHLKSVRMNNCRHKTWNSAVNLLVFFSESGESRIKLRVCVRSHTLRVNNKFNLENRKLAESASTQTDKQEKKAPLFDLVLV